MTNSTSPENQLSMCSHLILRSTEESGGYKFVFNPHYFVPVNVILSISSLLGNVLILIALQKDSSLHSPSKLLFRCLSFTDLCVGLIAQPLFIAYLTTFTKKSWSMCKITGGLSVIAGAILCGQSITTLTAISVDRLLALLLRLRYRQVVTLTRMRRFVIISWIINLIFVNAYIWNRDIFFIWCVGWILLCLSISICTYAKIYLTLRHQQAQIKDHLHANNCTSGICMQRYKKTISSALWVHLALLACYLPYAVVTAVGAVSGISLSIATAWNVAGVLVYFNSALNPVLYCWKIREVRQAVKATIRQINIFASNG